MDICSGQVRSNIEYRVLGRWNSKVNLFPLLSIEPTILFSDGASAKVAPSASPAPNFRSVGNLGPLGLNNTWLLTLTLLKY